MIVQKKSTGYLSIKKIWGQGFSCPVYFY